MNNFERRYWASYCDFIEGFKQLTYMGISIPLVSPYYVLIHDDLLNKLERSSLERVLKTKILGEKDLQSHFDKYLYPYMGKIRKLKGKIVLLDNVLRIPPQIMTESFNPSETLLLQLKTNKSGKSVTNSIPIVSLEEYEDIDNTTIKSFQKKATELLSSQGSHPIYSNKFFSDRLLKQIPITMRQISAAKKFFDSTPVSCLVLGTTNSSDSRILALVASSRGIPTICLQHGITVLEFGYLPRVATYLALYGEYEVNWYKNKGVSSSALKIIGHPRFDEISNRKPMNKQAFLSHYKLDPKKKTVLLVIHHEETEFPQTVIEELMKQSKFNIIVKPRNGKQRNSENTVLLQKKFSTLSFADDINLYDLLHNVDSVVSYESTIVLESMLANKPVFIWKLKSLASISTDYYEKLNDYIFVDPSRLINNLTITLEGNDKKKWEKNKDEFLDYHYPIAPGTSINKLIALIKSLIL